MNSNIEKMFSLKIDNKHYEWNRQHINGAEVRGLGNIPADKQIFLTIKGQGEDMPVLDDTRIDLSLPGIERFYSQNPHEHVYVIIVNGREKTWNEKMISYDQIVKLAFENYVPNQNTIYTVTYKRGPGSNPEGSMVAGDVVHVKNNMVFNVTATDRS